MGDEIEGEINNNKVQDQMTPVTTKKEIQKKQLIWKEMMS